MSIENDLNRIATALENMVELLNSRPMTNPAVTSEPANPVEKVEDAPPKVEPFLDDSTVAQSKYFQEQQELLDYTVAKYNEIGHERGKNIQSVLERMHKETITDLVEHEWDAFKEEIDKL